MAKPYTLRKTKGGPRMMTLSEDMMERMLEAPIDAVRLTLDLTFRSITSATGTRVVLEPDQEDRLKPRLGEPVVFSHPDTYLIWRWMTQGARAMDASGMEHLLKVTILAVEALGKINASLVHEVDASSSALDCPDSAGMNQKDRKGKALTSKRRTP